MIYLDSCILVYRREGSAQLRLRVVEAMPDADLAAELRATYRLRTPDALHAACAAVHGCRQLWTNDHRLALVEDGLETRVLP